MVRAKMKVQEIVPAQDGSYKAVTLQAVTDDENKSWSKWTPSGQLTMTITNPDAFNQFEVGQTYFLDFTPAPAREADEKPAG
jgi:hypothetical protein